jgi:hypothetical protein
LKSAKFALLTTNEHLALKLNPINNYSFAKNNHLVSVVLHELPKMSANYPVVFLNNKETFLKQKHDKNAYFETAKSFTNKFKNIDGPYPP